MKHCCRPSDTDVPSLPLRAAQGSPTLAFPHRGPHH